MLKHDMIILLLPKCWKNTTKMSKISFDSLMQGSAFNTRSIVPEDKPLR